MNMNMGLVEAFFVVVLTVLSAFVLVTSARKRKEGRLAQKALERQEWLDFWLDSRTSFSALMKALRGVKDKGDREILFDAVGVISVRRLLELFRPDQMWQIIEIMVNGTGPETVSMISGGAYADPDKLVTDIAQQLVEVLGGHDEAMDGLSHVSWLRHEGVFTTLRNAVYALQKLHECEVSGEERLAMLARGYVAMGATVPDLLTTQRGICYPASQEEKDPESPSRS